MNRGSSKLVYKIDGKRELDMWLEATGKLYE